MIYKVITAFFVLSTVFVSTNAEYLKATDVAGNFSVSQLSCIRTNGYSAIFTQIYAGFDGVDKTGSQNVINAHSAGLGTEVYINPYPRGLPSHVQFDEAYQLLNSSNIHVRTIWLKVTGRKEWHYTPQDNIDFIYRMMYRAAQYEVTLGIYTNWYDLVRITGNTKAFQHYNVPLWYWDAYGFGSSAESAPNFSDFRPFGSWNSASAKEYGFNDYLCSATISKIVYSQSASFLKVKSDVNMTQPVAGSAIL
uniref:GH26 domain-containing protein n=1 Tax=Strongyloides venezuelensis TaxID=75913 RepID=A0A0K0FGA9_STRVS